MQIPFFSGVNAKFRRNILNINIYIPEAKQFTPRCLVIYFYAKQTNDPSTKKSNIY